MLIEISFKCIGEVIKLDFKKRTIHYFTWTLPIAGFIATLLELVYFVYINGQHSAVAIAYCLLPLVVNVLIALPVWIFKRWQK